MLYGKKGPRQHVHLKHCAMRNAENQQIKSHLIDHLLQEHKPVIDI